MAKAKYKVGDKVRVRSDLELHKRYGHFIYVIEMDEFVKQNNGIVTIDCVNSGGSFVNYAVRGFEKPWFTEEMFAGLATEKAPKTFNVGDRVKGVAEVDYKDKIIGVCGTIRKVDTDYSNPYLVEFDTPIGGHDGEGLCKDEYGWWCTYESLELITEPKTEEVEFPWPITVNITVNINYDNACWYCRKDGLVDRYLAGRLGVCPSCGRVCNDATHETKSHKPTKPVNPPKKENKPLTTEELRKMDGQKVWLSSMHNGEERFHEEEYCGWFIIKSKSLIRVDGVISYYFNQNCDEWGFKAYREKPIEATKGD